MTESRPPAPTADGRTGPTHRTFRSMLFGLAVGVVFLVLTSWSVDWQRVAESLAAARLELLVPVALLLVLHYFIKALRWRVLLSGTVSVGPLLAMRLTMVGFFMNNILPARIGELGRPYLLSANRPEVSFPFALATVVGDKLFDLLLNILTLLCLSFLLPLPPHARWGILALVAAGAGLIAASLAAAVLEKREREGDSSRLLERLLAPLGTRREGARAALLGFARGLATASSASRAFAALGLSAVAFAALGGAVYLMLDMMNLAPSLLTTAAVIGLGGIGFMLPAPPTNAGNFHFFAAAALTVSKTAGADDAFSFAVMAHATQVVVVTALGAVSLVGLDWRRLSRLRELRNPE